MGIFRYKLPSLFGEVESDGDDDIDVPGNTDEKVDMVEEDGKRYKMDASGRWYQVDGLGDRIMKHRHRRRYVCGTSSTEWRSYTKEQNDAAFGAALDRRESEGKPRYPTEEEEV